MLDTADIADEIRVNTVSGARHRAARGRRPRVVRAQHRRRQAAARRRQHHRHQGPLHRQVGRRSTSAGPTCASTRSAATSTCCARCRHESGRLRARTPAALPAQPAGRALDARIRTHPGAERPVRRHLRPERGHHLPAAREARGGGARDQGGRRPQDRLRHHRRRPRRARRRGPATSTASRPSSATRCAGSPTRCAHLGHRRDEDAARRPRGGGARRARRAPRRNGVDAVGRRQRPRVQARAQLHEAEAALAEFRAELRAELRIDARAAPSCPQEVVDLLTDAACATCVAT